MAKNGPISRSSTGGRDRLFYLQYKQFTIIGGGRPAFILAVGAPLTIVPAFAILLGSQNQWFTLTIVLVSLVLYSVLAGYWIREEVKKPDL